MDTVAQQRWFTEEVLPHESALKAYLLHRFPQLGDVDDLVQESYLRLMQAHRKGGVKCGKSYLYAIARNAAVSQLRAPRLALKSPPDLDAIPALEIDDPGNTSQQDEADMLAEAIASLPARCREVFIGVKLHGLSYQEAAARFGLSAGTVHAQVSRGLKKCAEYFRARGLLDERRAP